MKKLITSILVALMPIATVQAQKIKVTIQCTLTADYCGGAAPTDEMLENLAKPKPLAQQEFYIVKGTKNTNKVYQKIVTDDDGKIKLNLPKGVYSVFSAEQLKKFVPKQNTENYVWDNACLLRLHQQPLLKFDTRKKTKHTFNMHKKCFYSQDCGTYSGPMPA
jgi:hypothetical protein